MPLTKDPKQHAKLASATAQQWLNAVPEQEELLTFSHFGRVISAAESVVKASGLHQIKNEELVEFENGTYGIAFNLDENETGIVLLNKSEKIQAGSKVFGTGRIADVPVGDALLGRVVDANGNVLDDGMPLAGLKRQAIESAAPLITERAPIIKPLQTGIKVIDALIPVGHGQRELIIGDRQTGKTTIAVDTIINQKDKDVICIYCAIGQRGSAVARVIDTLREHDALSYTVIVVGASDQPSGLQFITPYAATSIAEHFMRDGRDVLIVYDDMTKHARAYRELSLLLHRSPGREAYPGDIFYVHSRLLERATHLSDQFGGGSLTALVVVETQAQDIAAYIPTNLISITDGQIYLSPVLFDKAQLPAVDVGKSVSRVGGKTQFTAYRDVAGELRLSYAQFEELEEFVRFSARLDETSRASIDRGQRIREMLKQALQSPVRTSVQVVLIKLLSSGLLDGVNIDDISEISGELQVLIESDETGLLQRIEENQAVDEQQWQQLFASIQPQLEQYSAKPVGEEPAPEEAEKPEDIPDAVN